MVVFFALVGPSLPWAFTNLIDKVLTPTPSTDRALSLIFVSSGIGIITTPLLLLCGAAPWNLSLSDLIKILASGVTFVIACYPYFRAMQRSNPTTVVVLMQTIPVFNYLFAYLLLGEQLKIVQVVGMGFVILSCAYMCGLHRVMHEKVDFQTFFNGILCSIFFAIPGALFRAGAPVESFWDAACAMQLGTALPVFVLLLFPYARRIGRGVLMQLHGRFLWLNLFNEVMAQIAAVWFRTAFYIVPVSVAVPIQQGLQTFFVYLLSLGIVRCTPRSSTHFAGTMPPLRALAAIVVCSIGVYLLYH